jgi:hypothetical protein
MAESTHLVSDDVWTRKGVCIFTTTKEEARGGRGIYIIAVAVAKFLLALAMGLIQMSRRASCMKKKEVVYPACPQT